MKISASILSANFAILGQEVKELVNAGADYIHVDVMDGKFVPSITVGSHVVSAINNFTTIPLDVHLMIDNPDCQIDSFVLAGSDFITVHIESVIHANRVIAKIKSHGKKAGIALVPSTHESSIEYLLESLDLILIMSVDPGFAGQKFLHSQLKKIEAIKKMVEQNNLKILISVDGGINLDNAKLIKDAGADILVIGSSIFLNDDYKKNISDFRRIVF